MKKEKCWRKLFITLISVVFFLPVLSINATQQSSIDPDLLNEMVNICISEAKEDEVVQKNLMNYLIVCVQEELTANNIEGLSYDQLVIILKQSKNIKFL